ncbi:pantoate--beta-alanine ligase [Cytobacillus spongiae]|uniref:pantoate--beta-alanine ligase n=1 Tax=Cytobacillus spongiae TaxID=2901381 RepID=UPI001F3042E1|nr:pantoate--beta-alanine ligase [Cytobacillus spongiae]UII54611.1 pantoate--beta-alanine ligase [Cytobacillus spongiae]
MRIITKIHEMQEIIKLDKQSKSIGFVPTMGFLHEGHQALMKKAREENDILVLSIFVNPLQFGPNEDLDAYPRDIERDTNIAEAEQVDYLFFPSVHEMYPETPSVTVKVHERTDVLCGASRPGHFDGVATVLTKLFSIVLPDRVYLGMKDAQQVAVVEGLVSDFHIPLTIVPVETVREEDGLAKSSRNVNLLPYERAQAPTLYDSLQRAKEMIEGGERLPEVVQSFMKEKIEQETEGVIDYISIYSYPSLKPVSRIEGKIIIALAVQFQKARLIDNIVIDL